MDKAKLDEILTVHAAWLRDPTTGSRANLRDANLRGAYLGGADLRGAYLRDANLRGAYLRGANLRGANLRDANLRSADLGGADLGDADLGGADLGDANLRGANLRDAYLRGAKNLPTFSDAPDPRELRKRVADHIEAHPELHDQETWGDGRADTACRTPCCVAGWACHLGGGDRGVGVSTAAALLLHVDGLPMPSFASHAERADILAALRATA